MVEGWSGKQLQKDIRSNYRMQNDNRDAKQLKRDTKQLQRDIKQPKPSGKHQQGGSNKNYVYMNSKAKLRLWID